MRTSNLIDVLEEHARQQDLVARDLIQEAGRQRGRLLLGHTPGMVRLREEIALYARSDFPVLILGETGTGKELVVRDLHSRSPRADRPLIYVNCAALPESVAESELFGHVKGAFTGAASGRAGKFEVAKGGTLFLDEIGELPLALQPKLLLALQEGEIQRVGSDRTTYVDVRILAAGDWPGNVRELENLLSRSILLASERTPVGETILVTPEILGIDGKKPAPVQAVAPPAPVTMPAPVHLREAVNRFQREMIRKALEASSGNWAAAARQLGMHRSNLHHLARRLGLRNTGPTQGS